VKTVKNLNSDFEVLCSFFCKKKPNNLGFFKTRFNSPVDWLVCQRQPIEFLIFHRCKEHLLYLLISSTSLFV